MKEKERPILYISLALNLVLVVLLIISNTGDPTPTEIAAQPTTNSNTTPAENSPTNTYTPTPAPSETSAAPTATTPPTATSAPTNTPTPTIPPSPTPTFTPAATPLPSPTPSPTEPPPPAWLSYINTFRTMAGVKEVTDNPDWSEGSRLHSRYMVETDDITHNPSTNSQYFTDAGQLAAQNGNIAATEWEEATFIWAINYWMAAPFHGLPMLDPELNTIGFGFHSKNASTSSNVGGVNVAATLDVLRGLVRPSLEIINYPIFFPADGGETWILKHSLFEYPNPLSSCPGYSRPSGPPIMIQTGAGGGLPTVNSYRLTANGVAATACMFTEATYTNSNPAAQQSGRGILNARDAIVIIPLNPLVVGSVYEVTVTIDSVPHSAQFTAVEPPY